jgi:LPXTG-site transpeptidase (sortase) family protein
MGALYFLSYPNFFGIDIFSFSFSKTKQVEPKEPQVLSVQESSVFEEISNPIYGLPKKIIIEALGIDADLVIVGVGEDKTLESPKEWNKAGWYKGSSKPGEPGNLLINAHYDDNYGRPATFWKLKNAKVDDKVSILDSYARTFNYRVTNIYYIEIDDPEREKVFKPYKEGFPVMTLITCGGVWSYNDGTYQKRLVVNAELIQE